MKILVRATNWVGDAVMSIPALRAIRGRWPNAEIVILARPSVADLYRGQGYADRILIYENQGKHKGFWGRERLARALRLEKFDVAVLFQNAFDAAWIAWRARIPERIASGIHSREISCGVARKSNWTFSFFSFSHENGSIGCFPFPEKFGYASAKSLYASPLPFCRLSSMGALTRGCRNSNRVNSAPAYPVAPTTAVLMAADITPASPESSPRGRPPRSGTRWLPSCGPALRSRGRGRRPPAAPGEPSRPSPPPASRSFPAPPPPPCLPAGRARYPEAPLRDLRRIARRPPRPAASRPRTPPRRLSRHGCRRVPPVTSSGALRRDA